MRVVDEIATDFIQGLSFEAARAAHYAGRQKVKYDDFEFALRHNPMFLGKVKEVFEVSKDLKDMRRMDGMAEGGGGGGAMAGLGLSKEDLEEFAGEEVKTAGKRGRKKKDGAAAGVVGEEDIEGEEGLVEKQ
jgi:transcription initiation factor TFIID subunit 13